VPLLQQLQLLVGSNSSSSSSSSSSNSLYSMHSSLGNSSTLVATNPQQAQSQATSGQLIRCMAMAQCWHRSQCTSSPRQLATQQQQQQMRALRSDPTSLKLQVSSMMRIRLYAHVMPAAA
jgi:hypothetical protein